MQSGPPGDRLGREYGIETFTSDRQPEAAWTVSTFRTCLPFGGESPAFQCSGPQGEDRLQEAEAMERADRARIEKLAAGLGPGVCASLQDLDVQARVCEQTRQHGSGRTGADDQDVREGCAHRDERLLVRTRRNGKWRVTCAFSSPALPASLANSAARKDFRTESGPSWAVNGLDRHAVLARTLAPA